MRKTDFTLPKLDDLFTTQEMRDDAKLERVQNIPLSELHPFKDHPFKVWTIVNKVDRKNRKIK